MIKFLNLNITRLIDFFKTIIENALPDKYLLGLRYFFLKKTNKLEPEMLYVSNLLKNNRRFLDVGANIGIYSYHFKKKFKYIDAFEPLDNISYRLAKHQNESLKVHNIAISNLPGKLNFYTPIVNNKSLSPLSSLEKRDGFSDIKIVIVNTIDSFGFNDVDLIKIDVEGHEESVIKGGYQTIKKCKPIMIIEIEQRHIKKDINKIFNVVKKLNYNGFYLKKNNLISLDKFSYELNQKPYLNDLENHNYINNFIFLPSQ